MSKKITIIALVILALSLLAELMTLLEFSRDSFDLYLNIRGLLTMISHGYISNLTYPNLSTVNYLNVCWCALLLVSIITYTFSKGREMRLIRVIMAVMFISNALSFLSQLAMIYQAQVNGVAVSWWIFWMLGTIKSVTLIYVSRYILITFQNTRALAVLTTEVDGTSVHQPEDTSRWERVVNSLIDTLICIFVFSPFAGLLPFLQDISRTAGERTAIYAFILITRLIYYLFFEITLQASPAKFLTETRVTDDDGNKPSAGTIIKRTLARYIPFDGLSFLGGQGWHDSISYTRVVNEARTGVKGVLYILIIPALLVAGLIFSSIVRKIEDYKNYLYRKGQHTDQIEHFRQSLKNLTTLYIIQIEDIDQGHNDDNYLKIEKIDGDDITAVRLTRAHSYDESLLEIEELYHAGMYNENLSTITVKRSDLEQAFTPDYDDYNDLHYNTRPLLHDDRKFHIIRIEELFVPCIADRGTGSGGGAPHWDFVNYGHPGQVISLETLEGKIEWPPNQFPIPAPASEGSSSHSFGIQGVNYDGEYYKIKMTVQSEDSVLQTYILEGKEFDKKLKRIE